MINFNELPCDIKKIIYAINKNKEIEEYNNNKLKFNTVVQELETDFMRLAGIVGDSRIKEGVHYSSDNEYSILLVNEVLLPSYLERINNGNV